MNWSLFRMPLFLFTYVDMLSTRLRALHVCRSLFVCRFACYSYVCAGRHRLQDF